MTEEHEFKGFPKIPRLKRPVVITEKIDGTNAQVYISEDMGVIKAGSKNRWITPENDNYGFARWVMVHENELRELGPGRHFGEWWGSGIQRRYNIEGKRFSLFNTQRWSDERPDCCDVVPVLYHGEFSTEAVENQLERLRTKGSAASAGFMDPEGIVCYMAASRSMFKVTVNDDEKPKGI